jgi:hypothetical protein
MTAPCKDCLLLLGVSVVRNNPSQARHPRTRPSSPQPLLSCSFINGRVNLQGSAGKKCAIERDEYAAAPCLRLAQRMARLNRPEFLENHGSCRSRRRCSAHSILRTSTSPRGALPVSPTYRWRRLLHRIHQEAWMECHPRCRCGACPPPSSTVSPRQTWGAFVIHGLQPGPLIQAH